MNVVQWYPVFSAIKELPRNKWTYGNLKITKLHEPVGQVKFVVFEKFTSANNVHEKITRFWLAENECIPV